MFVLLLFSYMLGTEVNRRSVLSILAFIIVICTVIFLTYNRHIKQDDGWYASYVFKWMQRIGNTEVKSFWDYTDTNDVDGGCGFVFTIIEGIFFSIFGIGVISMKCFNAIEAVTLCCLLYIYLRHEDRVLGLITVISFLGWNMFHTHFFNRPELLASSFIIIILIFLTYYSNDKWYIFTGYLLGPILLDIHPLAVFTVTGLYVQIFIKRENRRLYAIAGTIFGVIFYFAGNYIINKNYGLFTPYLTGIKAQLGDHYIPIIETGWNDIWNITKERFIFFTKTKDILGIIKLLSFTSVFLTAVILRFRGKLAITRLLITSVINYITFIALSTFLYEATSNGFRLYHTITFGLLYFSILYSLYHSVEKKAFLVLGLFPFAVFAKDAIPKIRENNNYHKYNYYYDDFVYFNNNLPDSGKVLMRPTHAIFNYRKTIRFDYTYGLLRYMYKEQLSFEEAVILKDYDYIVTDEQFETEFFLNRPSPYRTSPAPYYKELKNTGITEHDFNQLVYKGFLTPVAKVYDAFAGWTIIYKVRKQ